MEFSAPFGKFCAQAPGTPQPLPYPPIRGVRREPRTTHTSLGMRAHSFKLVPAVLALGLSACDGAPSRNILGSYFPSWMVCAIGGIVAAVIARSILKSTGLLAELPAPVPVILAIGCAVTFGLWLLWLA